MLYPASAFRSSTAMNRRSFLAASTSLAATAVWSSRAEGAMRRVKFADTPFQLGVASGDPAADGFVIWTRLAPDPVGGGGMPAEPVEVVWQVAHDETFERIVREGKTVATPDWAHSVHVEVEGLEPDRWYFYRFQAGDEISPVGRARTFPAPESAAARMRFAFASCQHYESGLYTAYEHMLGEDLDLIAHLGDYIYEGATSRGNTVRKHNSKEIETLDEYRNRHALYKTDELLQAAHAACPWIVTWDDHEFDNNCAGDISEEPNVAREDYLRRRAAAYQAYYEHMPLRRSALPQGPDMQLYRKVSFGSLAEFFVLDTRQYRTDQPCGDGNKPPCDDVYDPQATLLGEAQEKWLFRRPRELRREVERAGAAGDDGPGGPPSRRGDRLQHGPVARLRDEPPPPAQDVLRAEDLQSRGDRGRYPQQLGQQPDRRLRRSRLPHRGERVRGDLDLLRR
jgi:alkaline phosphatase D